MRLRLFAIAVPLLTAAGVVLQLWSQPHTVNTDASGCCPDRRDGSHSNDPAEPTAIRTAAFSAVAADQSQSTFYVVGTAHLPGSNNTLWRTSFEVCNFGGVTRSFQLAFLYRGQSNLEPATVDLALAPGLCTSSLDILEDLFDLHNAAGALRLEADGDGIVSVSRTYNDTPDGTFGTAIAATAVEEALLFGERAVMIHLAQSASGDIGFRTNLDLLNVTDVGIDIEISLYGSDGLLFDTLTTSLQPFEYNQVLRVFRRVTSIEVNDGYAVVRTTTPGGAFLAGASLIDNRTGDPVVIEAIRPPNSKRWLEPENLGAVINSTANDWYPVFARDGSFMIFVSDRPSEYGSGDLYLSRRVSGAWQAPVNMGPNVNTREMDSAPYLSPDDSILYYTSSGAGGSGGFDIWYCPLEDGVAGNRINMGTSVNSYDLDCCPVISADGNSLYICSDRPGSYGGIDTWVSHRVNGVWQTAVNLGEHFNSWRFDSPRWLSDDGTTLIIESSRSGGQGDADLWYAMKSGNDWSPPVNFGAPINSRQAEWGPGFLDNDGAVGGRMCFGSGRPGGYGGLDVWCSEFGNPVAKNSWFGVSSPGGRNGELFALQKRSAQGSVPLARVSLEQARSQAQPRAATSEAAEAALENDCPCSRTGT
jgi:hypothetical protein